MSYKNDLWKVRAKSIIASQPTFESFDMKEPETYGKLKEKALQIIEKYPTKEQAYEAFKKEIPKFQKEFKKELIKKSPEKKKDIERWSKELSESSDLKIRFYELERIHKKRNLTPKEFKELKSIASKLKKLK